MPSVITFSIVIPFKSWSPDLEECLTHIKKLSLQEFEVILLPDEIVNIPTSYQDIPISIISSSATILESFCSKIVVEMMFLGRTCG